MTPPEVVRPPEPGEGEAAEVEAFLQGEGAALVRFHHELATLLDDQATVDDCRILVEDVLPRIADSPAGLRQLAGEIPDTAGRDVVVNEVAVAVETLAACAADSEINTEELEFHYWVVDGWLEATGA